ncbi:MAG: DUF3857 domain-containing protein [Ekhidna sp.]
MKLFIIPLLLISFSVKSQDYSISKIPEELTKNADAVVRFSEGEFEILSIDKAKYRTRAVITILNKDGNHNALISENYDKLISLKDFQVSKYDANGKKVYKAKNSDFVDQAITSEVNSYDDSRIRGIDLRQETFPYTIEYEYELIFKYLYFIPRWYFHSSKRETVEYSKYRIISPPELEPRYLSKNTSEPVESKEGEKVVWTWERKNLASVNPELYGPSFYDIAPHIIASPSKFEFDGYRGDLSTWDGFAKWQNVLNQGRGELPIETINHIKELTEGLGDREKIKTVYEYLQSKTRYVSIQLGIGGFQPFPAKFVDEVGYGDCKALSFYTKSLLEEVGVTSNYTIVYGGNNPPKINKDFPSPSYFNHVILSVPMQEDTIWLECTSQTKPFGYLGTFTSDRDVFVVTDEGGSIVRTPKYELESNKRISKVHVKIDDVGNGLVSIDNRYEGLEYEYGNLNFYVNSSTDRQKKWVENSIDIPSFSIESFEFANNKDLLPSIDFSASLIVNKLVSKSGTRFFLQPNIINKNRWIPNKDENRTQSIYEDHGYWEIDTITYELPEQHVVEAFFEPIEIISEFGEYTAAIKATEDGDISYIRTFKQFDGIFPNTSYQDYIDFHKKIVRADKKRISFKKKT